MRMWMVEPKLMCDRHLYGEHYELHMLAGTLIKGRSIDGYLAKGLLEPQNIFPRHSSLSLEMARRKGTAYSRLPNPFLFGAPILLRGHVDRLQSVADLVARCPECEEKILRFLRAYSSPDEEHIAIALMRVCDSIA